MALQSTPAITVIDWQFSKLLIGKKNIHLYANQREKDMSMNNLCESFECHQ